MKQESQAIVLTVGHSTRPLETFINMLKAHSVTRLIDVRTVPRSRHNPQFNRDTFPLHTLTPFAKVDGTAITYPPYETPLSPNE